MEIRAAVTESKGAPYAIQPVELDDPQDGEVLVRVAAAGICHTDLIIRDQWYPVPLPAVLGHEGAGVVERVGPGVTTVTGQAPEIGQVSGRYRVGSGHASGAVVRCVSR